MTTDLPRQQLLFDMLGDAARAAAKSQSAIDFNALGMNFTMATLAAEGAWGNSSNTTGFLTAAAGDTFSLANAVVAKHSGTVDGPVWCAVRDAGQTSYNTDKAGAIINWMLQSYMQNATCPFPCLAMPWKGQAYITVLGCE